MVQKWLLVFGVGAGLALAVSCGRVGTVCQQSGSTEGCSDGMICTFAANPGDPNDPDNNLPPLEVCLRTCENSTDCAEAELCQIVFCSDQKSCQTGALPEPPPGLCGAGGMGGSGGMGGTAGMGGAAGMGGTGGTGGTRFCDSTANAFIKTIDPSNNFALTNLVDEDTTNLPITFWSIQGPSTRKTSNLSIRKARPHWLTTDGSSLPMLLKQTVRPLPTPMGPSRRPTVPQDSLRSTTGRGAPSRALNSS
jgi:hypothetical protein